MVIIQGLFQSPAGTLVNLCKRWRKSQTATKESARHNACRDGDLYAQRRVPAFGFVNIGIGYFRWRTGLGVGNYKYRFICAADIAG
jgi:hypothetical protein